ncbi:MAG: hypothetical protein IJ604_08565 [Prevotella sp.]|nr:hypothetical protein [Prevotella sp.]
MANDDIKALTKDLDDKYPYSTDKSNYGQILSGVASRVKVHDIIQDIVTIAGGISKPPYNKSESKQFLYGYMNELIANLYEQRKDSSLDSFCEAWINIRENENRNTIRGRIEQIANSRGLEVDKTINDITKTFNEFEHNYKMLKQFSYGSNGYNQYLPLSKKGAALLLNYKFDPCGLPYGLGWSSNIFTEVEREKKRKKKEEEEKKRKEDEFKKERKKTYITTGIGVVVVLAILTGIVVWFASMDLGSDDGTIGNWIVAIIVLLAWLKGGKR